MVGASGCRGPGEVGRGREGGESKSEDWSGGSNDTLDAETEEDGWGNVPLTASPWGTQESGVRGLRGDARVSGSDGLKVTSATADKGETQGRHGARREQGEIMALVP